MPTHTLSRNYSLFRLLIYLTPSFAHIFCTLFFSLFSQTFKHIKISLLAELGIFRSMSGCI